MNNAKLSRRQLKAKVVALLEQNDFESGLKELRQYPTANTFNVLLGSLLHPQEEVKWKAVTAGGVLIADLAAQDMEAARVMLRRQLWNLTEESGGVPCGAPELIGESLANHERLAEEFAPSLISLIMPQGNYIDYEPILKGTIWAIGRLAQAYPALTKMAFPFLIPMLDHEDSDIRGRAIWTMGLIDKSRAKEYSMQLSSDRATAVLFRGRELVEIRVSELANEISSENG